MPVAARQRAHVGEVGARLPALALRSRRPRIRSLAAVCAQSEADAARLRALGAPRVEVTGNLKFDVALDAAQLAAGREWKAKVGRPVLLLASTREGEEKLLLNELGAEAVPHRGGAAPSAALRRGRAADAIAPQRSRMPERANRIYLGDTMGEMAFYYAACDVAVIGGSFLPLGGQNLIEALAAGAPVVFGPSMFNFAEATRLALEAGAAIQVADARPRSIAGTGSAVGSGASAKQMAPAGKSALRGAPRRDAEAPRGA